jgi:hypothetical protein
MRCALVVSLSVLAVAGCKGAPDTQAYCSDQPASTVVDAGAATPTWYATVQPLVRARCLGCHDSKGLSGLTLETYEAFSAAAPAVRDAVLSRRMPPFIAARCCTDYFDARSLTTEEIDVVRRFIDQGMPRGNPSEAPPVAPVQGLLSRVDVTMKMQAPYQPKPPEGSTDDNRCFAMDWPGEVTGYVTGLSPRPGNRRVVHHLLVAALDGDAAREAQSLDAADPLPGFDCNGGLGRFKGALPIGGSLVGGALPRGLGTEVKAGSVLLLNVHYSTSRSSPDELDLTEVDFTVDRTAKKASSIVLANPAWLVGRAMEVPAGEADVPFFYRFNPALFTGGKKVLLQGVSPHMHAFGKRLSVKVMRKSGERTCLLEIPRWEFGWEQPFWFAEPIPLEPDDDVYLECRFDNSEANQPGGRAPRDFAWGGNDQDMCAAFIAFTAAE